MPLGKRNEEDDTLEVILLASLSRLSKTKLKASKVDNRVSKIVIIHSRLRSDPAASAISMHCALDQGKPKLDSGLITTASSTL